MNKLKYLLILLVSNGGILCAQHTVSSITLTTKEFDEIYAPAVVNAKELSADTAILKREVEMLESMLINCKRESLDDSLMFLDQTKVVNIYKTDYDSLSKKYEKESRKTKFFRNTAAIFLFTSVILGSIIVLLK